MNFKNIERNATFVTLHQSQPSSQQFSNVPHPSYSAMAYILQKKNENHPKIIESLKAIGFAIQTTSLRVAYVECGGEWRAASALSIAQTLHAREHTTSHPGDTGM